MSTAFIKQNNPNSSNPNNAPEHDVKIPRLRDRLTEELVFAFVGPIGSGCSTAKQLLHDIFQQDYGYIVHCHTLSDFISQSASLIGETLPTPGRGSDRVNFLQTTGDRLRKKFGNSYLAAKAVEKIAHLRFSEGVGLTVAKQEVPKKLRHVHIIDSLKHPEELKLLRATYGDIFWLIGIFAPVAVRERRLTFQKEVEPKALGGIIQRDYTEDEEHGQKVRDVFYHADLFIRNDQENTLRLKQTLERFAEVLFGCPVHTPTVDESSMYAAYAEAAKSACLSRQVGAAIVNTNGELIGLGRNDVPRFGGGLYTEDDLANDNRCYAWQDKRCHNDKKKDGLYIQIYERLSSAGLLTQDASLEKVKSELKATDVKSLIEYSRAVHAEMDAITSVARTHKPGLLNGTLYSTTFPCHSCARHIVASGLKKVIFIEPYPKSLATDLHYDAVSDNEADEGKRVLFLQYSGIAPKNILKLFNVGSPRKGTDGKLQPFNKKSATPIVAVSLDDYTTHEKWVIAELAENEKASQGQQ